jgi:hypothetical protein
MLAIHSVIFSIRSSIGLQHGSYSIQHWLRNWNRVWLLRSLDTVQPAFGTPAPAKGSTDSSEERWRVSGFMKDCMQFWFLAQLVLLRERGQRGALQDTTSRGGANSSSGYDQAGMDDLKALLKAQYKRQ